MQVTLVPVAREEAGQVYELMLQSFVSEERRDEKGFYAALENAAYKLYHIAADGKISGFIGLWEVCDGAFVEHIAISPDCRGSGMGSVSSTLGASIPPMRESASTTRPRLRRSVSS